MIDYRWTWSGEEFVNQFGETWPQWLAAMQRIWSAPDREMADSGTGSKK
jgi:hypothetical protein